ncbi:lipopolysaccharide biosynthesis protein [Sporomusa malonica]|uniref:Membrane protein involved in the export of O-antigen and teichoic acid n=1 Tax=Sporomusa malonica TaxID=112901 RepID=A0A1W1YT82_9FIRM|nr:oligosaccharide flippase family protein [Sporomusa malonica]SMC39312.1 Membrane protein involved in the export of O-antigen and teichoic acid [Sporomusa malonica]
MKNTTSLSISNLFKQSFVYTIASVIQKGIVFLLLPVYTQHMSSEEYGIVGIVTTICGFYTAFYALGQTASAGRFYFEYKDDEIKRKRFIGTIICFLLIVSVVFTAILIMFNKYLIEPLAKSVPFYPFILLGIINIVFTPIYVVYQQVLQMQNNAFRRSANIIANTIILLSLNILFVVVFNKGAVAVIGIQAAVSILFFIISIIGLRKEIILCLDTSLLKDSLKYGLPILPHTLATWTMSMTDRLVLNRYASLSTVGIYNVGIQIAGIVSIIAATINHAYFPWACAQYERNDKQSINRLSESSKMIVYFLMLISVSICLFSKEAFYLFINPEYYKATDIISLISIGFIFQGIYYIYTNILYYYKAATKFIAVASWISAIVSLSMNFLLTPLLGIYGPSITCILAYFSLSIIAYWQSRKYFKLKINYLSINLQVVLAVGLSHFIGVYLPIGYKILYLFVIICILIYKYKVYVKNVINKMHTSKLSRI